MRPKPWFDSTMLDKRGRMQRVLDNPYIDPTYGTMTAGVSSSRLASPSVFAGSARPVPVSDSGMAGWIGRIAGRITDKLRRWKPSDPVAQ